VQYLFDAIGVIRSPFTERAEAPRQAAVAKDARGRIELLPGKGFEDALEGLDAWDYAWVLFVFHANVAQGRGWRPKVQPPRAEGKVGVFATRSPHRPNPIGMTSVRIERVEGLAVHVRELDLLDGTPVLDLKPYVPYADAHPDARSGWLEARDPRPTWEVVFTPEAVAQLAWLKGRGVDIRAGMEAALALGPQPHAYRRIRRHAGGLRLAIKEWRVDFAAEERRIVVRAVRSGYRASQLSKVASDPGLGVHRDFVTAFGS
jgi:tRNA-Thr(GGU) m(6)t(6)A37 methyltransferase TsaA